MSSPLMLPGFFIRKLDATAFQMVQPLSGPTVDFSQPSGESALVNCNSVAWRVFKNPVALFVGGVAAVILELAEPSVRAGVWEHTSFRSNPIPRLKRTGLAAMVTVYGTKSTAENMIARVRDIHDKVSGQTANGQPYRANDVELLNWVQGTASFGFLQAYDRYVHPLSQEDRDRFYAEGAPAARLYGASGAPNSEIEQQALFDFMRPRLEASGTVLEFLSILHKAPVFPGPFRHLQPLLIRAAVDMSPDWARQLLGLTARHGLKSWERSVIRQVGALSERLMLPSGPAVQACLRLGLPHDFLYQEG